MEELNNHLESVLLMADRATRLRESLDLFEQAALGHVDKLGRMPGFSKGLAAITMPLQAMQEEFDAEVEAVRKLLGLRSRSFDSGMLVLDGSRANLRITTHDKLNWDFTAPLIYACWLARVAIAKDPEDFHLNQFTRYYDSRMSQHSEFRIAMLIPAFTKVAKGDVAKGDGSDPWVDGAMREAARLYVLMDPMQPFGDTV